MDPNQTNETYDYDYDDTNTSYIATPTMTPATCKSCIFLAITNIIIVVLGVAGNGLVIWIAGFKMKKSVNTTWYLSLGLSDFMFCASLPFSVVYMVKDDWIFGLFMCKFTSFIMFLNMFSSIFLLVIISVDRCVAVIFPVWAQNQRTVRKASVIVVLVWIISAAFSTPSVYFRHAEFDWYNNRTTCFNDYMSKEAAGIAAYRFVFGFLIPFLIITICYVIIIQKLNRNQSARSKKPFKIMTALIATFLICWLPFHVIALMELHHHKYENIVATGQVVAVSFASANSCLNPFLYAFMGRSFKKKCYALLSKIENAIEEEGRSTVRGTSITTSGEGKFSTAV